MGRDWTPREQFLVDYQNSKERGFSFRNQVMTTVFIKPNGEKIPLYTNEDKRLCEEFKELGFLFAGSLIELCKMTSEHPRRRKRVLAEVEAELLRIEQSDLNGKSLAGFDETIVNWYFGKLDPNFYYREHNNRIFQQYLYNKIMKQ